LLILALSTAPLVPSALADGSVTIQEVDEQGNPIGKDAAPQATQGSVQIQEVDDQGRPTSPPRVTVPMESSHEQIRMTDDTGQAALRQETAPPAAGPTIVSKPRIQTRPSHVVRFDETIRDYATTMLDEGRQSFRYDTFGNERFWGGDLHLHEAIEGAKHGGAGTGLTLKAALAMGLKIDSDALDPEVRDAIASGRVDLDSPEVTLDLLRAKAIVGLSGNADGKGGLVSVGMQCALCHSTVDNSVADGVGRRLDGWANRDLDMGALMALAPTLQPLAELLGVDESALRAALATWGPGRFDPALVLDGKLARPDKKPAAVLIPPTFGLAGLTRTSSSGLGSVGHWASFASPRAGGSLRDPRLDDAAQFPVAAQARMGHLSGDSQDAIAAKLPALEFYQLSIPAPSPPAGSYDEAAAGRGAEVFRTEGRCVSCHAEGLTSEPGYNFHKGEEIGIDNFQAERTPERLYRTKPLLGLWSHPKGGFYHDGRFATLPDVVNHYDSVMALGLTDAQKSDLAEYLKSLGGQMEPAVASADALNGTTSLSSGGTVATGTWRITVGPSPALRGIPIRVSLQGIAAGGAPTDLETHVIDASGRQVTTLGPWRFEPARAEAILVWNGKDAKGRPVSAGDYTVRVTAPSAGYKLDRVVVLR
jgi:mono/diheme cytochrome c family protein